MNLEKNFKEQSKPSASAFHQQTLSGWKPIATVKNLYIPFFVIGSIFIISGSILIYFSHQIVEFSINYTNCKNDDGSMCSEMLLKGNYTFSFKTCKCNMNVTIPQTIKSNVFVYYGLSNFFQNHRRYVKSRDDKQLKGIDVNNYLTRDCEPYRYVNTSSSVAYAPCGIIANSLFNDTFQLTYMNEGKPINVPWTNTGIAWNSETSVRYGNPKSWLNTVKPPNWPISARDRSNNSYAGDEELIVWMRTAAFPNFIKLHRIIEQGSAPFDIGLPKGSYILSINYAYPVSSFMGTKRIIFSTTNYLGGRNTSLGIIYLIIGTIYFSIAIGFVFIKEFVSKRQSNEAWYISTQNGINVCSNETFCHIDAENNNGFIDQCSTDMNQNI